MTIRFYRTRDPYGCFSNFSRHPVTVDGVMYPTSEHYFQWAKHAPRDAAYAERIRNAPTPREAADLARDRMHMHPMRPDWDRVKDDVMRLVLLHKFVQHDDCQATLLGTGDDELIEATTDDYYWGEGTERTGKNMLGKILMEVRGALRTRTMKTYQQRVTHRLLPMRFEGMACNCASAHHTAEQLLAGVRAELARGEDPKTVNIIEAVVCTLGMNHHAGICAIDVDQWFSVAAETWDRSFTVFMECDTVELGFAGIYRVFTRHARILAVLMAIPEATWAYTAGNDPKPCIGSWSCDGTEQIVLQYDGRISWTGVDPEACARSPLWAACRTAGFEPVESVDAPVTPTEPA